MKTATLILAACGWTAVSAVAADNWTVEAYLGNAYNFRSRLKIEQDGGYARSLHADYDTKAFETPLYYTLRVARWAGDNGWEVSFTHHKLYLQNPPDGVASLSVSHGFNIVTLNRAYRSGSWTYRFGVGPVVTHAEGIINGIGYDGPYKIAGAALLAGGGRRFYLGKSLFFSLEAMATAAYANPKMSGPRNAEIKVPNFALHGLAGIGWEF